MNIIANDCAGAYIYRDCLKSDFMNPFIWSSIDIVNFSKLIKFYDSIDFNKIDCELIHNDSGICKQGSEIPKIRIDNKVDVHYFHYIQKQKYSTPTKIEGYTMCDNIIQYTVDSYMRRVDKMSGRPTFIWDVTKCSWYNKTNLNPLEVFKTIDTDCQIIVYSPFDESYSKFNLTVLKKPKQNQEVNESAYDIYKRLLSSTL